MDNVQVTVLVGKNTAKTTAIREPVNVGSDTTGQTTVQQTDLTPIQKKLDEVLTAVKGIDTANPTTATVDLSTVEQKLSDLTDLVLALPTITGATTADVNSAKDNVIEKVEQLSLHIASKYNPTLQEISNVVAEKVNDIEIPQIDLSTITEQLTTIKTAIANINIPSVDLSGISTQLTNIANAIDSIEQANTSDLATKSQVQAIVNALGEVATTTDLTNAVASIKEGLQAISPSVDLSPILEKLENLQVGGGSSGASGSPQIVVQSEYDDLIKKLIYANPKSIVLEFDPLVKNYTEIDLSGNVDLFAIKAEELFGEGGAFRLKDPENGRQVENIVGAIADPSDLEFGVTTRSYELHDVFVYSSKRYMCFARKWFNTNNEHIGYVVYRYETSSINPNSVTASNLRVKLPYSAQSIYIPKGVTLLFASDKAEVISYDFEVLDQDTNEQNILKTLEKAKDLPKPKISVVEVNQ